MGRPGATLAALQGLTEPALDTGRGNMYDTARGASPLLAPQSRQINLRRLALAGLVGTSALAIASGAQAHITKITILSSSTAFGGYSFPGVGRIRS